MVVVDGRRPAYPAADVVAPVQVRAVLGEKEDGRRGVTVPVAAARGYEYVAVAHCVLDVRIK